MWRSAFTRRFFVAAAMAQSILLCAGHDKAIQRNPASAVSDISVIERNCSRTNPTEAAHHSGYHRSARMRDGLQLFCILCL